MQKSPVTIVDELGIYTGGSVAPKRKISSMVESQDITKMVTMVEGTSSTTHTLHTQSQTMHLLPRILHYLPAHLSPTGLPIPALLHT
jgi:hypothetical protein